MNRTNDNVTVSGHDSLR